MMVSMSSTEDQAALVDLLNTTPVVDGHRTESLDGAWLRDHGAPGERVAGARLLRDALQAVVRGESSADVLSGYLRDVVRTPAIADGAVVWRLDAGWAARMVLAWGELQASMPGRLRPCANDECLLFLLDRSRAGTGRWCSMSGCGNRMKARRHYDRSARKS